MLQILRAQRCDLKDYAASTSIAFFKASLLKIFGIRAFDSYDDRQEWLDDLTGFDKTGHASD